MCIRDRSSGGQPGSLSMSIGERTCFPFSGERGWPGDPSKTPDGEWCGGVKPQRATSGSWLRSPRWS
eukprot:6153413-Alexandrium_andersonii.AAC.1